MAVYLVTGGAGFIGSHIVEALLENRHQVKVIDNLSTGKEENLRRVIDKIEFVLGDIRDYSSLASLVKGVDYILHQAAIPSVTRSFADPLSSLSVNGEGTLQILKAAKEERVKGVVYASSSSVYGDQKDFKPKSPYGISKLLGEQYCVLYSKLSALNIVCLRYFNVFGPRQDPQSQYAAVVPKFIHTLRKGEAPTIDGDGEQERDFTFVRNVVKANLIIRTPGIYDIGCGERTTVNKLYQQIKKILNLDLKAKYGPARPGDIRSSCARIDRTIYEPVVSLEQGLRYTINE